MKKHFIFFFLISVLKIDAQINLTSSSLPIIIIDTHGLKINDEPKITASMGIIDNGNDKGNNITDPLNGYNGKIGIEIRGHSSQMFPKKQYGIELRDDLGNSINASLLGMPPESDWVLNASYTDKTFLRNVITYKLGNDMGRYASRTRFCEVIINGQYLGLYILQEKVKRDKNRVDIKKLDSTDTTGDALTGGYIIKIDRIDPGDKYFNSQFPSVFPKTPRQPSPISFIHVYPNANDILPVQQEYIKNYITKFETSLSQSNFNDPFTGYYNYIDIDSFVDYYLVSEFVKAVDAYRLSVYMYKNRDSEGGKLVFGPLWDYDLSLGLPNYFDAWKSSGWQAYVPPYEGIWSTPFWTRKIFDDPVFFNKLAKRWHELKDSVFNPIKLIEFLDKNALHILEARVRNFIQWSILGVYIWPEKFVGQNYEEEILYLKGWISQRYNWMDSNLPVNYSYIEWKQLENNLFTYQIGKELKLPLNLFYGKVSNVTSLQFACQDPNINFRILGDTVTITASNLGEFIFKGIVTKNSAVVSISPEYRINLLTGIDDKTELPQKMRLYQNYPNPFNSSTMIVYQISSPGYVSLKIYDVIGNEIATLDNEYKQPGIYKISFPVSHLRLASGLYYYKLSYNGLSLSKKMILLK